MSPKTWGYILALALATIFIFILIMWISCEEHYCFFETVNAKIIYGIWILMLILFAGIIYWFSFTSLQDEHIGVVMMGYYVVALLGILLFSWFLFGMSINSVGWLGIGLIVIGALIFLSSCCQ